MNTYNNLTSHLKIFPHSPTWHHWHDSEFQKELKQLTPLWCFLWPIFTPSRAAIFNHKQISANFIQPSFWEKDLSGISLSSWISSLWVKALKFHLHPLKMWGLLSPKSCQSLYLGGWRCSFDLFIVSKIFQIQSSVLVDKQFLIIAIELSHFFPKQANSFCSFKIGWTVIQSINKGRADDNGPRPHSLHLSVPECAEGGVRHPATLVQLQRQVFHRGVGGGRI